ncbi:MAG: BrnT family toxin [Pseudomonadales bacterium]
MKFEWDAAKDRSNQRKHGLSFGEAQCHFDSGANYLEIFDEIHSISEDRYIGIGWVSRGVVVVVYTVQDDDCVRIIGARFATRAEQELYRTYMDEER